ncbi:MAG: hypothetical protein N4A35_13080 [Flavobacteriales bacterium]|jgi:YVTN family beta-propeller protein|nr:hypothetical protein [Flavobacteriales bacterium]
MRTLSILLIIGLLLGACRKKEVGPQRIDGTAYHKEAGSKVVIGCEGNFGWGNASMSVYNAETKVNVNQVFSTQNSLPLGDVFQSSTLFNGDLFVVVNNSNKIEVVDTTNFLSKGTITGLTSPRYFLGVSPSKAYVSDLYANAITIVNPTTFQVTESIPVSAWTEQLVLLDQTAYVTQKGSNQVLLIDVTTDAIIDSITVGREPNSLVLDTFDNLWVLCSGGVNEAIPSLVQINTATNTVMKELFFSSITESPNNLQIDTSGTQLIYLNSAIYQQSISSNTMNQTPVLNAGNIVYYGLGVNPYNNEIYLSDAKDYVQAGTVYRYSPTLELIDHFNTGIIPQDFTFLEN